MAIHPYQSGLMHIVLLQSIYSVWEQLLLVLPMVSDVGAGVLMKQKETNTPKEANGEALTQNTPAGSLPSGANPSASLDV